LKGRQEVCVVDNEQHLWKANAQSEFNRWAQTYDQSVLQRLLFRRCYIKFFELILKYYPQQDRSLRLLDVGCGTGTFASMLGRTSLPVCPTGLDMAQNMCQLAHRKVKQVGLEDKVQFVTADSEQMPFVDNTFDLITCSNSYHHYPHQEKVLAEMLRVLKPGGRVMIMDGYRDNVLGWLIFDLGVGTAEKSVHHCSAAEIRRQLLNQGYGDLYQEKMGFWCPVLVSVAKKA
jgi:ubiquinone/menaquinone biosynthesis C-methylase UbiE